MRTSALLAVILLVAVSGARPAQAGGTSGAQVTVTRHGITVTLRVPGVTYPRGALMRALVTMKNSTAGTVRFGLPTCRADTLAATVEVLNAASRIVFPPALPAPPQLADVPCTLPEPPVGNPGGDHLEDV